MMESKSKSGFVSSKSFTRVGAISPNKQLMDSYNATTKMPPAWNFGSSTRPPLQVDEGNPGPGAYKLRSVTTGKIMDSQIRSSALYSLRSREKFGNPMLKAVDPTTMLEPGPGHYRPKVVNPRERNAPLHSFPKALPPRDKNMLAPGPGAYDMGTSVGRQVLSTKRSDAGMEFGTSNRPPLLLVSTEVGPGQYDRSDDSCARQPDSRKRSCPLMKFGTGSRDQGGSMSLNDPGSTPGPGDYKLAPALCGGGSSYVYKAAPKCSMSGRNKFGSPFNY